MLKPQFLLTHKIPITIYRRAAGTRVEGEWIEGAITEVVIQANIQPLKDYEIQQMPESDRTRVWFKLYSAEEIRTLKEGVGGWSADEFLWKGDRYKVMKVQDWSDGMGILEHFRAHAARIPLTPN